MIISNDKIIHFSKAHSDEKGNEKFFVCSKFNFSFPPEIRHEKKQIELEKTRCRSLSEKSLKFNFCLHMQADTEESIASSLDG